MHNTDIHPMRVEELIKSHSELWKQVLYNSKQGALEWNDHKHLDEDLLVTQLYEKETISTDMVLPHVQCLVLMLSLSLFLLPSLSLPFLLSHSLSLSFYPSLSLSIPLSLSLGLDVLTPSYSPQLYNSTSEHKRTLRIARL